VALVTLTVPVADPGIWTASTISFIASATPSGLQPSDVVEVYGSTLGTEPTAVGGTLVGRITLDAQGKIVVSPAGQFWGAYPFYRLRQAVGNTPAGSVKINGT
jgi:hypothetical protein